GDVFYGSFDTSKLLVGVTIEPDICFHTWHYFPRSFKGENCPADNISRAVVRNDGRKFLIFTDILLLAPKLYQSDRSIDRRRDQIALFPVFNFTVQVLNDLPHGKKSGRFCI